MAGKYDKTLDRESAFEMLRGRAEKAAAEAEAAEAALEKAEEEAKAAKKAKSETPSLREFKKARRYAGKAVETATRRTTSRRSPVGDGIGGAIANVVISLKGLQAAASCAVSWAVCSKVAKRKRRAQGTSCARRFLLI